MWGIFKLSRRWRQTIFSCPQDAYQRLHDVVKPLDRATSPVFASFLVLKPLVCTLDCDHYQITALGLNKALLDTILRPDLTKRSVIFDLGRFPDQRDRL